MNVLYRTIVRSMDRIVCEGPNPRSQIYRTTKDRITSNATYAIEHPSQYSLATMVYNTESHTVYKTETIDYDMDTDIYYRRAYSYGFKYTA